jgi:hypothetical protein
MYIAVVYFLPVYFQLVLGATPVNSGIWLLATALSMGLATVVSGVLIKQSGRYLEIIWMSVAFSAFGFALLTCLPSERDWARMITFQIIVGWGLGPLFQAPLVGLLSQINQEDIASANALYAFLRLLGSSLSIVTGQVVIQNRVEHQSSQLQAAGIPTTVIKSFTKDFTQLTQGVHAKLTAAQRAKIADVLNSGLKSVWILYMVVAIVACFAAMLIDRNNLSPKRSEGWEEMEEEK